MDYDELVQRLRVGIDGCIYRDGPDELMDESADAIETLQADLAAARALLERVLAVGLDESTLAADDLAAEIEAALAGAERKDAP
jgi:hypothetical protein